MTSRAVVCAVVVGLVAAACGGPTAPARISTDFGNVIWVDPAARKFGGWAAPTGSFDLRVGPFTSFSGNGIRSFTDLVNLYRAGKKLSVVAEGHSGLASSVELTSVSGPFPVTFHKHLYAISLDVGLWSGTYHDQIAFVLPWTKFRQDADYTSFEAVKAVLSDKSQPLCMAGEGYEVHVYGIHTTTVGVWRAKDNRDSCEGR